MLSNLNFLVLRQALSVNYDFLTLQSVEVNVYF